MAAANELHIEQLSWLTGRWQGEHEGGLLDEQWMAPAGRSMLGISRLVFGEKTASAEFMLLEEREADGSLYVLLEKEKEGQPVQTEFRMHYIGP